MNRDVDLLRCYDLLRSNSLLHLILRLRLRKLLGSIDWLILVIILNWNRSNDWLLQRNLLKVIHIGLLECLLGVRIVIGNLILTLLSSNRIVVALVISILRLLGTVIRLVSILRYLIILCLAVVHILMNIDGVDVRGCLLTILLILLKIRILWNELLGNIRIFRYKLLANVGVLRNKLRRNIWIFRNKSSRHVRILRNKSLIA